MDDGIIAIAGIAGTLLGTVVGAASAAWIQRRQLEHEDRTRFHEQRLAAYADFNDACNRVASALVSKQSVATEDMARFVRGFETVRLVASKPVRDAAGSVHTSLGKSLRGETALTNESYAEFNNRVAALCIAMRAETGIDKS
jgi:hypothetical protein